MLEDTRPSENRRIGVRKWALDTPVRWIMIGVRATLGRQTENYVTLLGATPLPLAACATTVRPRKHQQVAPDKNSPPETLEWAVGG